jgi:hypothetical protein
MVELFPRANVRYAPGMGTVLSATLLLLAAAAGERPALIVTGAQPPARIARATVLTPAEGPPVVLYAAENLTDQQLDTITVMAFVFTPAGTLKARHIAPGRRTLEPHETKYSTLVIDGSTVDPTDVIVIGINQAQRVGSDAWWRADLQPAAEAAVPLKKP